MMGQKDIRGFVLVGGKSSRMRQDKALMQFEGKPLALWAAGILRPFVHQVTLLGPVEQYADLGLPVLADQWPDQGPLAAVCTGLLHSTSEWNIFLACDLPLISGRFLQHLVKRTGASQSDAVVPRTDDGWQPLCAAYHARCRPVFMRGLQENRRSMVGFFDEVRVEAITSAEMVSAGLRGDDLANINTPEEWARIVERPKGSSESC